LRKKNNIKDEVKGQRALIPDQLRAFDSEDKEIGTYEDFTAGRQALLNIRAA